MSTFARGIAALTALALIALVPPARAANDKAGLDKKLQDAATVYQELVSGTPDRGVPQALLAKAKCIAVIPHVYKGAIGWGARFGHGVMTCRNDKGEWSPPTFVKLTGLSGGAQIGFQSTDLVLFFLNENGAKSLMNSKAKISLGGQAGVAAGPLGRSAEANTDLKLNAEIYSYAKSKGLFAGVSLEGARLAADNDDNAALYGRPVTVQELLFGNGVANLPESVQAFLRVLPTPA